MYLTFNIYISILWEVVIVYLFLVFMQNFAQANFKLTTFSLFFTLYIYIYIYIILLNLYMQIKIKQ